MVRACDAYRSMSLWFGQIYAMCFTYHDTTLLLHHSLEGPLSTYLLGVIFLCACMCIVLQNSAISDAKKDHAYHIMPWLVQLVPCDHDVFDMISQVLNCLAHAPEMRSKEPQIVVNMHIILYHFIKSYHVQIISYHHMSSRAIVCHHIDIISYLLCLAPYFNDSICKPNNYQPLMICNIETSTLCHIIHLSCHCIHVSCRLISLLSCLM